MDLKEAWEIEKNVPPGDDGGKIVALIRIIRILETAQRATKDSVSIKNKIVYLGKELELKREECQRHKASIRQMRRSLTDLTDELERLKKALPPKQESSPVRRRVDAEDIRKLFLEEIRKWLVTGETVHQLLARLKEMELPGGG